MTDRLKRAVTAGYKAALGQDYEYPTSDVGGSDKDFTQALIADLIKEEPPYAERSGRTYNAGFDNGYALAIRHLRIRAGLEE